jgi:hypothetical protein
MLINNIDDETVVGFACGHIYHLSHLDGPGEEEQQEPEGLESEEPSTSSFARSVGPKVTHAFILKEKIGEGCRRCVHNKAEA